MICSRPLELPAVHFLCGDSFHQTYVDQFSILPLTATMVFCNSSEKWRNCIMCWFLLAITFSCVYLGASKVTQKVKTSVLSVRQKIGKWFLFWNVKGNIHFWLEYNLSICIFRSFEFEHDLVIICLSYRKVMDIIKAQENNKDLHEQFHKQVTLV